MNSAWAIALAGLAACANTASLRVRNDIGDLNSDYNHGTELNGWWDVAAPGAPTWASALITSTPFDWLGTSFGLLPAPPDAFERHQALHWRVGQLMFVPTNISIAPPDPRDRPYGGWLYTGLANETLAIDPDDTRRHDQRTRVEVNVGIVGPSSLSEVVQSEWHGFWGLTDPKGWSAQIKDEPTLLIAVQRDLRLAFGKLSATHEWDLAGHFDWNAGNLRTSANLGGVWRLGKELPRDFGFRSRPTGAGGGSVFVFGDVHAIAQDLFLDGNTWKSSPSVDKEPFVGEFGLGFDIDVNRLQLRVGHLWRSEEFETQHGSQGVWFFELAL